jgi:SAM-dependent methyltransferase
MAMNEQQLGHKDKWDSGSAYEPYVGRWSRLVAAEFLRWLNVPAESRWLDVGCGTGALTETILKYAAPSEVKGVDRSEGFIDYARRQVTDERAQFEIGDAQALPIEPHHYDAAVSGLVLNFVPQSLAMVQQMAQAVKLGGVVAVYVWDYSSKMQLMRHFWNAAAALDPKAADLDEGRRFPLCNPQPLTDLFQNAGLNHVETRWIDIPTDFKDFDDYWQPFVGGQGPAPTYTMSLSEEHRAALRDRLRASLPVAIDGSIPLVARAWAVRGFSG